MNKRPPRNVSAVFDAYPDDIHRSLLQLRELILDVATSTEGVGPLTETLKWGQPSYLTEQTRSGTTVRLDRFGDADVAVFVHCQTSLIGTFRGLAPELTYAGDRAIVLSPRSPFPEGPLRIFLVAALTYHR